MAVTGHFTQERWLTNGVVTHTIDYGYDVGGKLVSAGDASSQYLYTYDANGHLDVVTESGSGLGAVYTFDYDANVAGDIVAVAVSVNGSVDHVENYAYDANHRMTQVLQSGAGVAAKRVDIAYVDNRVGTLTRYANLSGTQLVATSTCEVTFRLHSCNVCTKGSRRTTGAVATTTAGNESSMLPPRCCCFPKSLEAMRLARLRRVRHRLNLPRSSHVRH